MKTWANSRSIWIVTLCQTRQIVARQDSIWIKFNNLPLKIILLQLRGRAWGSDRPVHSKISNNSAWLVRTWSLRSSNCRSNMSNQCSQHRIWWWLNNSHISMTKIQSIIQESDNCRIWWPRWRTSWRRNFSSIRLSLKKLKVLKKSAISTIRNWEILKWKL